MKRVPAPILVLLLALLAPAVQAANDEFPGRRVYPDVNTLNVAELADRLGSVVVVDARSRYEYDTIHINGAVNILLSRTSFEKDVRILYDRLKKPIVFYCNGHTCMKSYKAARRAMQAGIRDVYAFDAGIFDWARAHPDKAALLGRSPVRVNELISKKDFRKRLLEPEEFQKRVTYRNVLVLDVHSRLQRAGTGLFPFDEKFASLDDKEKLNRYLSQAKREGKTVLAYDAVGKQVRWLEYYLRSKGIRDYYFMKGGADGYVALLARQQKSTLVTGKSGNTAAK